MCGEDYELWIVEKFNYLKNFYNFDDDLSNYIISWFNSIKGKKEASIINEFNPNFLNSTDEEIFKYINTVRGNGFWEVANEMDNKGRLNFDLMFAFYLPLILKEYKTARKD